MLIWGWRTVFRVVGSGVFSCPSCGADRNYERRRAQRFFTLFFLPLIPLKTVGEFIRCTYCKTDFRESVLARPTAAQFTDLLQNTVRGVMVNVLRRGGAGHPAASAVAVEEIVASGAVGYSHADLAQDMQVVPEDLTQMLAGLAGQLPEAGREALVRGAIRVAAADGPVDAQERMVIDTVGAALGMTQAHVAGVVASVPPAMPGTGQQPVHGERTASYDPLTGTGSQMGSPTGSQTAPMQPPTGFQPAPQPPTGFQPAPQPPTGFQPAPQQAPAGFQSAAGPAGQYGAPQDAVPPQFDPNLTRVDPASSMETMVIPPRPAPAQPPVSAPEPTLVHEGSAMETMMLPEQPAAPVQDAASGLGGSGYQDSYQGGSQDSYQGGYQDSPTVAISAPVEPVPAPAPPVAAPVAPVPDPESDSASMQTMIVPLGQVPPQRPQDSADEPTHVTPELRPQQPGDWPPHQQ